MDEHPNAALLRQAHAALDARDMDRLAGLLAESVAWHTAGQARVSGDCHGRAAVLASVSRLLELSGGTLTIEDEDLLASPERAVSLCRVRAARAGKTLDVDYCEVIRVGDGRIVEGWSFAFDQYAFDQFWL